MHNWITCDEFSIWLHVHCSSWGTAARKYVQKSWRNKAESSLHAKNSSTKVVMEVITITHAMSCSHLKFLQNIKWHTISRVNLSSPLSSIPISYTTPKLIYQKQNKTKQAQTHSSSSAVGLFDSYTRENTQWRKCFCVLWTMFLGRRGHQPRGWGVPHPCFITSILQTSTP